MVCPLPDEDMESSGIMKKHTGRAHIAPHGTTQVALPVTTQRFGPLHCTPAAPQGALYRARQDRGQAPQFAELWS